MARIAVYATHGRASDYMGRASERPRTAMNDVLVLLNGINAGIYPGSTGFEVAQSQATGMYTVSGGSGVIGAIINGQIVSVTWAVSDGNSAGLLVAAINAETNPLVAKHVTATNSGAFITLTARYPGHAGNAVTTVASGTGITAMQSRLTGGTDAAYTY